ncbi:hypothetical protein BH23GEM3_BH23GEM3_08770 [soil metagenome]
MRHSGPFQFSRPRIGIRLLGIALGFVVVTGQASTDGCTDPEQTSGETSGSGAQTSAAQAPAATYKVGDAVSIQWSASWWPGRVLAVEGERYRIRYDDYDSSWDEWVTAARLRRPESAARPSPTPAPAAMVRPDPAPRPTTPAASGAAATQGIQGTWRYESWISRKPGQQPREMMNDDVIYWLTLRPNGTWSLSNTTRWGPNSPDFIAGGSYALERGQLVLTQSGTPARRYGRYRVEGSGSDRVTLRDADAGDVIVLRRGRG